MGYLVKKAAGAPYEGHVASSDWGADGRLYHDDVANQLRILNRLYKAGKIDKASYKAYQKELVAQVDPQQLQNSFMASQPGNEAAARRATQRFFSDSVSRGLMDRQSAARAVSTARKAPVANKLTFSYTPGRWVDTRTGETYNPNAPVASPVKKKALPKLPKVEPVQLVAPPATGYTLSALSPTQAPAPTVTAPTPAPTAPVPAPAPAPAPAPVKKPKVDPYKQALKNGWTADDTTYGRGWVSRKNADGTTTYKSPTQIRTGKGSITVGPSDVQKPVKAPATPVQPKQ